MEEEIWKDIKEFEGKYQVSTLGRVKSLNYNRTGREGILNPGYYDKNKKYLFVVLCKNGKRYNKKIHQLVAGAFIPNPENKPCIDHIDGNPMNNNQLNLRYCTHKENNNNPITRKRRTESLKGRIITEETKKKISKSHKGLQAGEKNPMYGKHLSEEHKKKISESHKGLLAGEKNPMYGKHLSEEHKKKISESLKGLYAGEKNPMYGKHHSEETRNKISNTQNKKPIVCLKDNKVIKIYNAICDVDKDGFNSGNVCSVLKGRIKTYKGYNWMYLSEYEKMFGQLN